MTTRTPLGARGLRPETSKPPVARRLLEWQMVLRGAPLSSVGAALRCPAVVSGPEAGTAPAGRHRIRVVHGEAGTHQGVDIVDLRTLQEAHALAVDVDLDAVDLEELVLGRRRVLQHHPVAVAGAATGIDVDAQADIGVRLGDGQLLELSRGGVRERDHRVRVDMGLNERGLLLDHRSCVLLRTGVARGWKRQRDAMWSSYARQRVSTSVATKSRRTVPYRCPVSRPGVRRWWRSLAPPRCTSWPGRSARRCGAVRGSAS